VSAARTRVALRWHDLDMRGHVNQVTYHEFMEEGRAVLLEPLGDFKFVLARVEMNFRHEVRRTDDVVDIVMQVTATGRSSITVEHQVLLPDGTVAADGRSILVAWDEPSRGPRPLTDAERAALTDDADRPDLVAD
jgi:acyl-CoA thioester hydrolase